MPQLPFAVFLAALGCLVASGASATDRAEAQIAAIPAPQDSYGSDTFAIVVVGMGEQLWSGSLRVGDQYGNASFSQSKNEFAEYCAEDLKPGYRPTSSNHQLSFNISRRNWQQEPDMFNVNVSWMRPLPACEGEGSNSIGFNRVVELPRGESVTLKGAEGMLVRLTRSR